MEVLPSCGVEDVLLDPGNLGQVKYPAGFYMFTSLGWVMEELPSCGVEDALLDPGIKGQVNYHSRVRQVYL